VTSARTSRWKYTTVGAPRRHSDPAAGPHAPAATPLPRPSRSTRRQRRRRGDAPTVAVVGDLGPVNDSPLNRIETAFINFSHRLRPASITLPASLLGGAPDEHVSPLVLRTRLKLRLDNHRDLIVDGVHISDRVWHHIAPHARSRRGEWMLVAVGMAVPALRATVPDWLPQPAKWLMHSDLVYRMVELLAGEPEDPHEERFDLDSPYLFNRLMDRVRYAGTRSPRRSTAPGRDAEWDEFETLEMARDPDSFRLPRLQLGDPLITLAGLVSAGDLTRLDAALLARTALLGQSRADAITLVRHTLPADVGPRSDEALRGRLEQARRRIRRIYQRRFEIHDDTSPAVE
jgi:hypothetical protein